MTIATSTVSPRKPHGMVAQFPEPVSLNLHAVCAVTQRTLVEYEAFLGFQQEKLPEFLRNQEVIEIASGLGRLNTEISLLEIRDNIPENERARIFSLNPEFRGVYEEMAKGAAASSLYYLLQHYGSNSLLRDSIGPALEKADACKIFLPWQQIPDLIRPGANGCFDIALSLGGWPHYDDAVRQVVMSKNDTDIRDISDHHISEFIVQTHKIGSSLKPGGLGIFNVNLSAGRRPDDIDENAVAIRTKNWMLNALGKAEATVELRTYFGLLPAFPASKIIADDPNFAAPAASLVFFLQRPPECSTDVDQWQRFKQCSR